jgi:hypothetical protein
LTKSKSLYILHQASVHKTIMILLPQQNHYIFLHQASVHKTTMALLPQQTYYICMHQASVHKAIIFSVSTAKLMIYFCTSPNFINI